MWSGFGWGVTRCWFLHQSKCFSETNSRGFIVRQRVILEPIQNSSNKRVQRSYLNIKLDVMRVKFSHRVLYQFCEWGGVVARLLDMCPRLTDTCGKVSPKGKANWTTFFDSNVSTYGRQIEVEEYLPLLTKEATSASIGSRSSVSMHWRIILESNINSSLFNITFPSGALANPTVTDFIPRDPIASANLVVLGFPK